MNTKTTKRAIYPNLEIKDYTLENNRVVEISTILRKEYKGKWYLINHLQRLETSPGFKEDQVSIATSRMIKEVYKSLYLYKFDESLLKLKTKYDEYVVQLDEDQTTEEERLKSI